MSKIDILNREPFVEQIVRLVENISENKTSTCFAINGAWGCGKSFVLDRFEERLNEIKVDIEEKSKYKYFIIRYNSWKFDYYEEPLIALVATIISAIEDKTEIFPDSKEKQQFIGMLKATGVALISATNEAFKEKTGIDGQSIYKTLKEGSEAGKFAFENEHEYDVYFDFKRIMEKLSDLMQKIAEEYTTVLLVDELDRCIPEYAIKVLERLHHLLEESSNIITIVATDKNQLSHSISHVFGIYDTDKYLEKFFSFEVALDCGTVSENITEKYSSYIEMFDKDIFPCDDSIEELFQAIFSGIEIRKQEQIFKKVSIAHKLLYNEKKDYSFMCMELIIAVMVGIYGYRSSQFKYPLQIGNFDTVFVSSSSNCIVDFSNYFKEKFSEIYFVTRHGFPNEPIYYMLPSKANLYVAIIFLWSRMHNTKGADVVFKYNTNDAYTPIINNHVELRKFVETIEMMI